MNPEEDLEGGLSGLPGTEKERGERGESQRKKGVREPPVVVVVARSNCRSRGDRVIPYFVGTKELDRAHAEHGEENSVVSMTVVTEKGKSVCLSVCLSAYESSSDAVQPCWAQSSSIRAAKPRRGATQLSRSLRPRRADIFTTHQTISESHHPHELLPRTPLS